MLQKLTCIRARVLEQPARVQHVTLRRPSCPCMDPRPPQAEAVASRAVGAQVKGAMVQLDAAREEAAAAAAQVAQLEQVGPGCCDLSLKLPMYGTRADTALGTHGGLRWCRVPTFMTARARRPWPGQFPAVQGITTCCLVSPAHG